MQAPNFYETMHAESQRVVYFENRTLNRRPLITKTACISRFDIFSHLANVDLSPKTLNGPQSATTSIISSSRLVIR